LNDYPKLGDFIRLAVKNASAWRTITHHNNFIEHSGFVYDTVTPCFAASVRLASKGLTPSTAADQGQ